MTSWRSQYQWPLGLTLAYGAVLILLDRTVYPGMWRPIIGGPPEPAWFLGYLARCVLAAAVFIALWHIVTARAVRRGLSQAAAGPLATFRLAHMAFVVFVLVPLFYHFFRCWKAAIQYIHPFRYDVPLATLDAALHGGDPWRLLHGLTTDPGFVRRLDSLYTAGYMLTLAAVVVWVAWRRPDTLRARFLAALVLMWVVLGTVVAIAASSGGPVFYERIVGSDRFAPLLASLEAAGPLFALTITNRLWVSYVEHHDTVISGISAFPSLHVAMPVLYACYAWSAERRWLAAGFVVLTLVTLFASVYLAWHYAVDGYAAIIGVLGLWWLSGRLVRARSDV